MICILLEFTNDYTVFYLLKYFSTKEKGEVNFPKFDLREPSYLNMISFNHYKLIMALKLSVTF